MHQLGGRLLIVVSPGCVPRSRQLSAGEESRGHGIYWGLRRKQPRLVEALRQCLPGSRGKLKPLIRTLDLAEADGTRAADLAARTASGVDHRRA